MNENETIPDDELEILLNDFEKDLLIARGRPLVCPVRCIECGMRPHAYPSCPEFSNWYWRHH